MNWFWDVLLKFEFSNSASITSWNELWYWQYVFLTQFLIWSFLPLVRSVKLAMSKSRREQIYARALVSSIGELPSGSVVLICCWTVSSVSPRTSQRIQQQWQLWLPGWHTYMLYYVKSDNAHGLFCARADSKDDGMTEELRCLSRAAYETRLCFYILESDRKFELWGLECKGGDTV